MSASEWALTALVVLAGSVLQSATGMGLGLLIGPVLILVMDSVAAITVAVVLNLAVSLVLLPKEIRELGLSSMLPLLAGCVVGIPLGQWLLAGVELDTLKLLAGVGVSIAAVQLLLRARPGAGATTMSAAGPLLARATTTSAGLIAGIMTASLAMPGPALMWGMGHLGLDARTIRANLRALFAAAYSLALISHLLGGVRPAQFLAVSAGLAPALLVGTVLGHYAKAWLSENVLKAALEIILLVMGVSLLANALWS